MWICSEICSPSPKPIWEPARNCPASESSVRPTCSLAAVSNELPSFSGKRGEDKDDRCCFHHGIRLVAEPLRRMRPGRQALPI